jgi:hypothetical protein
VLCGVQAARTPDPPVNRITRALLFRPPLCCAGGYFVKKRTFFDEKEEDCDLLKFSRISGRKSDGQEFMFRRKRKRFLCEHASLTYTPPNLMDQAVLQSSFF